MSTILEDTLRYCKGRRYFFKYLSANDVGTTRSHQSGFLMPVSTWSMFLPEAGIRGRNAEADAHIQWCDGYATDSRYEWYGEGTRREYRLTRFGRRFEFRDDAHVGSVLVMVEIGEHEYWASVLDADNDIDAFLACVGSDPTQAGKVLGVVTESNTLPQFTSDLVWSRETLFDFGTDALCPPMHTGTPATQAGAGSLHGVLEPDLIAGYVNALPSGFPSADAVAIQAREIQSRCRAMNPIEEPDRALLDWQATEYRLFQAYERHNYERRISQPFITVDELVAFANTLLNRRKSRAGSSLENHLEYVFGQYHMPFTRGGITEDGNKPDFIFPGISQYHAQDYPMSRLVFLGAKTTCKDRWRQILDEADRIETKHLFTLQQGISANQLYQMQQKKVILVVPGSYKTSFPEQYRGALLSLRQFIDRTKERLSD
jgi:hypothetical protein